MRENEKNTLLRDWVPPGHGLLPILSIGVHALGLKKRTGLAPFDPTFGKLLSTLHAQMKFTDAYQKNVSDLKLANRWSNWLIDMEDKRV